MNNECLIVVASHKKMNLKKLDLPYKEIYRLDQDSDSNEYEHSISSLKGIKNPSLTWSEYPAFYYPFPLHKNIKTLGLNHYRTFTNFLTEKDVVLPFSKRYSFLKEQSSLLLNLKLKDNTIIIKQGHKFTKQSIYQQTIPWLNNAFNANVLHLACLFFDQLIKPEFSIDSLYILKNTNIFYTRNLFLSHINFANKWYDLSYKMIKFLDNLDTYCFQDPRWGAYILERLFSVYVSILRDQKVFSVIERPVAWFE